MKRKPVARLGRAIQLAAAAYMSIEDYAVWMRRTAERPWEEIEKELHEIVDHYIHEYKNLEEVGTRCVIRLGRYEHPYPLSEMKRGDCSKMEHSEQAV